MRIVCTIVKTRMMTTKSNSMMAFTSVEDLTGTLEVIVFPRVLDSSGMPCRIMRLWSLMRLSVREDEPPKLMAKTVTPIDQYGAGRPAGAVSRPAQPQRLYLRLPSRTCPQYDKVINLLEIFDGSMPVILYLQDTKQKLGVPRRLYASGHPLLMQELQRLLGIENVATK